VRKLLLLGAGVAALAIPAGASVSTITQVMHGLDNEKGLAFGPEGALYVADAGCSGSASGLCWTSTRPDLGLRRIRRVPSYTVNEAAVAHAKRLIAARQYVLRSRWQDVQPRAREQNAFLKAHSWEEYADWHLGLTEGADEETKARFAFVYGDFRRLHRMGLIACHYRAAEWRHKEIELAAHELLQYLDRKSAS
jgi:hypothetical protein